MSKCDARKYENKRENALELVKNDSVEFEYIATSKNAT